MPRVFVSDAILQERLVIGQTRPNPDEAPRGWKALSARYQAGLAACGWPITPILRPEIYQTDLARRVLGVEPGDWHLAVKPIEHLRPFHGIPNVFVCDWPYPELSAAPLGDSPFFDQARLLRMADAVLCCTDVTRDTLRAAGVERAITLPPYSPPPSRLREGTRQGAGCRFLAVVDADHLSRPLGSMIDGFAEAARQRDGLSPSLSLVLCLPGAGAGTLAGLRQRVAQAVASGGPNKTGEPDETIAILGGDPADLYAAADFFLCAEATGALPLPLVDALLAGLPAVTTMTAGIASLLPPEAVVPIATGPATLGGEDEPIARFLPLTVNPPSAEAVRDAALAASQLDDAARGRLAGLAQAIAERRFGLAAFRTGLDRLAATLSIDVLSMDKP